MTFRWCAATVLAVCIAAASPTAARSSELVQEIQAVNERSAQKDYAQAIPHAERAIALARDDPSVSPAQLVELLNVLAQLHYLRGEYADAERAAREVLTLRQKSGGDVHAVAVSEEDVAELLDLQGKFAEAAPLHESAAAGLATIFRGGPAPSSAFGAAHEIRDRAFDFYSANEHEDSGYGRYTYVVLSRKKDRGTALLALLLETSLGSGIAPRNRARVNAFEIPVMAGKRTEARAEAAAPDTTTPAKVEQAWGLYDFAAAHNLLLDACGPANAATLNAASTAACADLGAGPFLITFLGPLSAAVKLPERYLIVDLSSIQTGAFSYIVKSLQTQLEATDFSAISDPGALRSTWTSVLNVTLVAADWMTGVVESTTQLTKLVQIK